MVLWPEEDGHLAAFFQAATVERYFIYDGWNVVMIVDGYTEEVERKYTWGPDLSGSLQGAGGIGGLLAAEFNRGEAWQKYWYTYDANGNVGQLLRYRTSPGETVTLAGGYEYDPYGNTLAVRDLDSSGIAEENEIRFSTKWLHDQTGTDRDLYYYGYRFYSPSLGRWMSWDPIQEQALGYIYALLENSSADAAESPFPSPDAEDTLYGFLANHPVDWIDALGLQSEPATSQPSSQPVGRVCLCPRNTCDRWKLTIMLSGTKSGKPKPGAKAKAGVTAGAVHAQLTADSACDMRTHFASYEFLGVGAGVGLSISGGLNVNSVVFDTPCIEWEAHAGAGRVATAGLGLWWTYGTLVTVTPQTNQTFWGWGKGLDLSVAEMLGVWAVHLH